MAHEDPHPVSPPRPSRVVEVVRAAIVVATLGLAGAWVIAWAPLWPCMLLEHFRVQYVVVGTIVVAGAAALRLRGYLDVVAVTTLLNLLPLAADLGASRQPGPADGIPIRVLVLNVHTESRSFAQVRQLIADEQPDVIGLLEVDQAWLDALAPAVAGYPGRIEAPNPDNFGVALYARGAVAGTVAALPMATVIASVSIDEARFRVLLTHPMPPMNRAAVQTQQEQLDAVAAQARGLAGPVLVLGDLNATPWSWPFRRLMRRSGLCDSRAGFGIQASFPAGSWFLRIPIDHLLASCSVGVRDRRIGRDVGSDHLPVIVDLEMPR